MPEINGNEVKVGDTILVSTQVAQITQYDELADRMTYVIGEGRGVNYIQAHVSNTNFRLVSLDDHTTLAQEQGQDLDDLLSEVTFETDPHVEEDPDTDRVKGPRGAKMANGLGGTDEVISG